MSEDGRRILGVRIRALREEAGLKLEGLSLRLREQGTQKGTSITNLSQVELGNSWPGDELVRAIDNALAANGELIHLLREAKVPATATSDGERTDITAHLFFPLLLQECPEAVTPHQQTPFDCISRLGIISDDDNFAALHIFPFKVVVLHERHVFTDCKLGDIAVWRESQIKRCTSAAQDYLVKLGYHLHVVDTDPYCFTCFVIKRYSANDRLRHRATQILSTPSTLLEDGTANASYKAEALLHSESQLHEILDFSVSGSHFGAASWAAVAISPNKSDTRIEDALVNLEIQLQALWCYANNIAALAKFSHPDYADRFLKQSLSHFQRPRATEHMAVRRLREALVESSRIRHVIDGALTSTHAEK